jgi:hypothetical protein
MQMQRSAYTFRSHGTGKSKGSSIVPSGALLIAPDGEILAVGGTGGHHESKFIRAWHSFTLFSVRCLITGDFDDTFGHQPSTNSLIMENNDQATLATAPPVHLVRLPDETVIRRSKLALSHRQVF